MGDLYAAETDWERAIAEYRKLVTDQTTDGALLTKLARAYRAAGRSREAVAYTARTSAADPADTMLSLKVAALQAWFGQDKELAATRERILAFAKGADDWRVAELAAKACSILPSTDKAQRDWALVLSRKAVHLGTGNHWGLLALGMAEYRSGHFPEAEAALLEPHNDSHYDTLAVTVSFYRAMSLHRRGEEAEARKLAIATAARMKPLPKDENNPPMDDYFYDDLISWLAYKEAKAMIQFDAATPSKADADKQ
jgi:Flp pilus assembly protein TadD